MAPVNCPLCGYVVNLTQINFNEAVYLCSNMNCTYPIGLPNLSLEFVERDYKVVPGTQGSTAVQDGNTNYNPISDENMKATESFIDNFFNKTTEMHFSAEDINEMDMLFDMLQSSDALNDDVQEPHNEFSDFTSLKS